MLGWSAQAWGQAASTTGQSGLINMPDARIAPDGTLRFGYSFADPYVPIWSSVTILPRLEVSGRFTRIMRVPAFPNRPDTDYGDFKDKSVDGKFVLFEESERWPQFSLGVQDVIGTKIFPAYYAVASKRFGDVDFTLGYGGRRIDGLFGGVRYRPKGLENWAFVAEYDANDYSRDPGAAQSGAASLKKQPGVGVEYTWGWVTGQLAYTRENPAIMAYLSIPLGRKDFIPKVDEPAPYEKVTPRPTLKEWLDSDEHRRHLVQALADQDFRNIRIAQVHNRLEVTLTNVRISQVSRAVGRAARTILLLSPIGTREIKIIYTVADLPVVTYSFFELERLQRYFNGQLPRWELAPYVAINYAVPGEDEQSVDMTEMLKGFDEKQPGFRVLRDDQGDLISLKFEDLGLNRIRVRPSANVFLNDPSGAFKYEVGIEGSLSHRLAPATFFTAAVNWNLLETVSDVTQPSNSTLPHVRSDIAEYKRGGSFKLTRLLVNQFYQPAERVYARASGGYYEEMYAGTGGQVLYLSPGARWAADLAVDWVKQRDFDGGFGFRDYSTVTAIGSLHYRMPMGITATARAGRFLAKDEGVRVELKRRFASGYEVGAFYTYTNGNDITSPGAPDNPYHDKGIFLRVPLNTLLTKDTQARSFLGLAPWTRDVGQMVSSPADLYGMLEKPLIIDAHTHDGLSQFGDRDDDYHRGPPERTLFDRPFLKDLDRDLRHSGQTLGDDRAWKAVALGVGSVLLSATADSRVDRWARDHGKNRAVETTADFGNALPFAAFAGAGLLALGGDARAADTGFTAVQSGLTGAAISVAAKYAVGRLRPGVARNTHDFDSFSGKLSDKSFPSDRTTLMWATVTPIAKEYEMPWLYGLAALTNFGRVADRKHWFSDTVAGSLLGYGVGSLLWDAHRKPERRSVEVIPTWGGAAVRSRW